MVRPFRYIPLKKLPFRYLPPNFATVVNMIVGLLAIIFSVKGEFETAAWLVVLAVLIDGVDGILARILKAQSHFGIEFDSFSDFVSFGMAPPAVIFCYLVNGDFPASDIAHLVWISLIGGIFYVLMAAIRLARFNVQTLELGDRIFHGMPTTLSAGLIATFYLTLHKYGNPVRDPVDLVLLSVATFVLFGCLMVSVIPLLKIRKRRNLFTNIFEKTGLAFCMVLAITRRMPDVLLFAGILYFALGVRFGLRAERQLGMERTGAKQPAAPIVEEEAPPEARPSR